MCAEMARKLRITVTKHEKWRRRCLNLIPAENVTSSQVRQMLASDLGHRYQWDDPWYGGQKFTVQVEQLTVEMAKLLFDVEYANVRPLSGHLSLMAVLMGVLKPGDTVLLSSVQNGGYPLNLQARFPLDIHFLPYRSDRYSMDAEGAVELVERIQPRLVLLGASIIPFPHPVQVIAGAARAVGATVVYDGSHVLGLIAGGQFQDPLGEGAEILLGSTHKTMPGPQGGIILIRENLDLAEKVDVTLRPPPVLVDNYHNHRVAALGITLAELLHFGQAYAQQVVRNAQRLAKALNQQGVNLVGADRGFTASHQVLISVANEEEGHCIRDQLEAADIIADAGVRLGTQEVTRRGMREAEMDQVAELISDVLIQGKSPERVKKRVHSLVDQFQTIHYCFNKEN